MPKGYTKNRDRPSSIPARTRLHGITGTVPKLYDLVDARLRELGWNWTTLAKQIPFSRTYLRRLMEMDTIPEETFVRICQILDLDPTGLIQPAA